jgi:hypothetical protein
MSTMSVRLFLVASLGECGNAIPLRKVMKVENSLS